MNSKAAGHIDGFKLAKTDTDVIRHDLMAANMAPFDLIRLAISDSEIVMGCPCFCFCCVNQSIARVTVTRGQSRVVARNSELAVLLDDAVSHHFINDVNQTGTADASGLALPIVSYLILSPLIKTFSIAPAVALIPLRAPLPQKPAPPKRNNTPAIRYCRITISPLVPISIKQRVSGPL